MATDPVPPGPAAHLDTTVVIEQCKTPKRARPVVLALDQFPFKSTSTYGRYEFKRTWVRDMVWLYENLGQHADYEDVLSQIGKSFGGSYSGNRLSRMLEVMAAFVAKLGPTTPKKLFALRLREYLANAVEASHMTWQRSVTHEFNETGCIRADEVPSRGVNDPFIFTLPNCRPSEIHCRVHTMFDSNRPVFGDISAKIASLGSGASSQLTTMAAELAKASADPKRLCDNRNCAKLGDALIAVDGRRVPVFAANNDAEWVPISEALGKDLINPTK